MSASCEIRVNLSQPTLCDIPLLVFIVKGAWEAPLLEYEPIVL